MRAIINTAPGRLEMQDLDLPEPAPGQVRIKVSACGICATDLEMIAGWDRTGFPAIPGHEWTGSVDKVGAGVDPELEGKACVAENVLSDGGEVGFEHSGGYAEYLITDAVGIQLLPASAVGAEAALIEPLAVSVRGIHRARIGPEDRVLIFGDGPIGLLTLMLLCRQGLRELVLVGGRDARLALAREMGASTVINYHDLGADPVGGIQTCCERKFNAVVEATGRGAAMQSAMELADRGGRILVLGDYGEDRADFPWNAVLHSEFELIGSCASAEAWPDAVAIAAEPDFPLDRLVTHRLPAPDFQKGMDLVRAGGSAVIKVILEWR